MFTLRFSPIEIPYWAGRYPIETDYEVETVIAPRVQERGYYTGSELAKVCYWKTPRSKKLIAANSEDSVSNITRFSLSTSDERQRIEGLLMLIGVGWPTATVLLHFGFLNLYPIHDYRALWSLGIDESEKLHRFSFWQEYTIYCRWLASEVGVSLRTLDRALWQYSKENQPK